MARGAEKIIVDGHSFDSSSEAAFYLKLKKANENGDIQSFDIEPMYILQDKFDNWRGDNEQAITHYPDYLITLNNGDKIIADSKGGSFHETDAKLKRKMWMNQHKDIPYYYVSISPKFIGGEWVETSPAHDFDKKLRLKHKKLYGKVNNRLSSSPKLMRCDWDKWFDYDCVAGLFYKFNKMYTKKELEKRNNKSTKPLATL